MSLKRVVQAMTVCAVLGSTHTYAEERNWDKMEQRMAAQEEAIRQLTERLKQYETTNQRLQEVGYQQEKEEKPLVQFGGGTNQLAISGDLRLRYEDRQTDNGDLNRFRHRLRIRLHWINDAENWEAGVQFTTGTENPTSMTDTYSEDYPFEATDMRLSYAYIRHEIDNWDIYVGQHVNPYLTTNLQWDGAVMPVGVSVGYNINKVADLSIEGFFAIAGMYDYAYAPNDDTDKESFMYGGQLGYGFSITDASKMVVAATAYIYDNDVTSGNTWTDSQGNSDPELDYTYQLIDITAKNKTTLSDDTNIETYFQGIMNIDPSGSDKSIIYYQDNTSNEKADDNNMAYTLGGQVNIDKFFIGGQWMYIEADSVNTWFSESTFGLGTGVGYSSVANVEGIILSTGYNFTKNIQASFSFMDYQEIEKSEGTRDDGKLYQFNITYQF